MMISDIFIIIFSDIIYYSITLLSYHIILIYSFSTSIYSIHQKIRLNLIYHPRHLYLSIILDLFTSHSIPSYYNQYSLFIHNLIIL